MTKEQARRNLEEILHASFNFDNLYEDSKHKSEICRAAYHASKRCRFQDQCDFAHSIVELCPRVFDHINFKNQRCSKWPMGCQYGTRCLYLHDEKKIEITDSIRILHSKYEQKFRIIRDQGNGTVSAFTLDTESRPQDRQGRELVDAVWHYIRKQYNKVGPPRVPKTAAIPKRQPFQELSQNKPQFQPPVLPSRDQNFEGQANKVKRSTPLNPFEEVNAPKPLASIQPLMNEQPKRFVPNRGFNQTFPEQVLPHPQQHFSEQEKHFSDHPPNYRTKTPQMPFRGEVAEDMWAERWEGNAPQMSPPEPFHPMQQNMYSSPQSQPMYSPPTQIVYPAPAQYQQQNPYQQQHPLQMGYQPPTMMEGEYPPMTYAPHPLMHNDYHPVQQFMYEEPKRLTQIDIDVPPNGVLMPPSQPTTPQKQRKASSSVGEHEQKEGSPHSTESDKKSTSVASLHPVACEEVVECVEDPKQLKNIITQLRRINSQKDVAISRLAHENECLKETRISPASSMQSMPRSSDVSFRVCSPSPPAERQQWYPPYKVPPPPTPPSTYNSACQTERSNAKPVSFFNAGPL